MDKGVLILSVGAANMAHIGSAGCMQGQQQAYAVSCTAALLGCRGSISSSLLSASCTDTVYVDIHVDKGICSM